MSEVLHAATDVVRHADDQARAAHRGELRTRWPALDAALTDLRASVEARREALRTDAFSSGA